MIRLPRFILICGILLTFLVGCTPSGPEGSEPIPEMNPMPETASPSPPLNGGSPPPI